MLDVYIWALRDKIKRAAMQAHTGEGGVQRAAMGTIPSLSGTSTSTAGSTTLHEKLLDTGEDKSRDIDKIDHEVSPRSTGDKKAWAPDYDHDRPPVV